MLLETPDGRDLNNSNWSGFLSSVVSQGHTTSDLMISLGSYSLPQYFF